MRLKFSEFLALGAFAGWFINYMKFKKTWAKWLFGLVCLGSIGYIIFSNEVGNGGMNQTATTSGNNSPALNQSATTTGSNSPVLQAAAGSTINYGISETTMRELLRDKSIAANNGFSEKYPFGYVLFGSVKGKIIYEPNSPAFTFKGLDTLNISFDPKNDTATLDIPYLTIIPTNRIDGSGLETMKFNFPLAEDRPVLIPIVFSLSNSPALHLFIETVDRDKGMFLFGLK